jgi:hypothetical protein
LAGVRYLKNIILNSAVTCSLENKSICKIFATGELTGHLKYELFQNLKNIASQIENAPFF